VSNVLVDTLISDAFLEALLVLHIKTQKMNIKSKLSILWIFLSVNFIFCDVFTLMHAKDLQNILNGKIGDIEITQEFLLAFAVIMEIPMIMIVLSRLLKRRINRILNIAFGFFLLFIQSWSLTTGDNSLHYIFFSIVEVLTCVLIISYAWNWKSDQ
jgi:hypothetical protein